MMTSLARRVSCALSLVLALGLFSPVDAAQRKAVTQSPDAPSIARYSDTQIQQGGPQIGIARAATDSLLRVAYLAGSV